MSGLLPVVGFLQQRYQPGVGHVEFWRLAAIAGRQRRRQARR